MPIRPDPKTSPIPSPATFGSAAPEPVAAVVLAGGLSRRMGGGDKMLLEVGGRTLLQRVIDRTRPQVCAMLLNVNGDPARFSAFGLPTRSDAVAGYAGPLAGILTGLEWLRDTMPGVRWLVSLASDTPMLPEDLVAGLLAAVTREQADIGCAQSGDVLHPVFGLWPVRLAADLRHALVVEDVRKVGLWMRRYKVAQVSWPVGAVDPFFNINTPDDLAEAEGILQRSR